MHVLIDRLPPGQQCPILKYEIEKTKTKTKSRACVTFSVNNGDADAMSDSALNNRLLPIAQPSTHSIANQRVYNPTTFTLANNGSNYSPMLSETSSYSDNDSQRPPHQPADVLGLPHSGARTRWEPSQQRQLLQAHAQSFVNSQGKTETEIF